MSVYDQQEIELLRSVIAGLAFLDDAAARSMSEAVAAGQCSPSLAPFWELATSAPDLWRKLARDQRLDTYSIYGFFPGVYELVYQGDDLSTLEFSGRTRGRVALIRGEGRGLVVKPLQSGREGEIARIAGDLAIGPRQYPSIPGFLTEELCAGEFFTELPPERLDDAALSQLGRNLGHMLVRLHSRKIYYNDATISDPEGRSHLLVSPDGKCRLIDFGVSVLWTGTPG